MGHSPVGPVAAEHVTRQTCPRGTGTPRRRRTSASSPTWPRSGPAEARARDARGPGRTGRDSTRSRVSTSQPGPAAGSHGAGQTGGVPGPAGSGLRPAGSGPGPRLRPVGSQPGGPGTASSRRLTASRARPAHGGHGGLGPARPDRARRPGRPGGATGRRRAGPAPGSPRLSRRRGLQAQPQQAQAEQAQPQWTAARQAKARGRCAVLGRARLGRGVLGPVAPARAGSRDDRRTGRRRSAADAVRGRRRVAVGSRWQYYSWGSDSCNSSANLGWGRW